MRVIPLTSILSHKGRGCRSPKRDDALSPEVRELFKHPLRGLVLSQVHYAQVNTPQCTKIEWVRLGRGSVKHASDLRDLLNTHTSGD